MDHSTGARTAAGQGEGTEPEPYVSSFDDSEYTAERPTLSAMLTLVRLLWPYWRGAIWLAPIILFLGLVASIAEGSGVGVIILLLSVIIRGKAGQVEDDGLIGMVADRAVALTGGSIGLIAMLAVALVIARVATLALHGIVTTLVEGRISDKVRQSVFRGVLRMPFADLNARTYGEILTVLDRHSWSVAEATDSLASLLLNGVIALTVAGLLFILAPSVAIIALVGTLLVSLTLRVFDGPAERAGIDASVAARRVNGRAMRLLQAMRTVRAFGQYRRQMGEFAGESDQLRRAAIRSDLISGVVEPISHVASLIMITVIAVVGVRRGMSYETILASVVLLYRLQPYVSEFGHQRLHLATLLGPVRAVTELASMAPPDDPDAGLAFDRFRDAIQFEAVDFGYPDQQRACLRQASFTIPRDGWTLIEGDSGAGKSTIVSLLLGFYAPLAGRIVVDGVALNDLDSDAWLARIAVAGQDVELIDGTVFDNILLSRPEASKAELQHVIEIAGLESILASLENGGLTRIGERGLNLSGGQRQRLGIARALLRKSDILILDEATSALDAASEQAIFAALVPEMAGRTVVLIGHRLSPDLPIRSVVALSARKTPNAQQIQIYGTPKP